MGISAALKQAFGKDVTVKDEDCSELVPEKKPMSLLEVEQKIRRMGEVADRLSPAKSIEEALHRIVEGKRGA